MYHKGAVDLRHRANKRDADNLPFTSRALYSCRLQPDTLQETIVTGDAGLRHHVMLILIIS
jgi:hypothetical protein